MDVGRGDLELQKLRNDQISRLRIIRHCNEQLCLLASQIYEGEIRLRRAKARPNRERFVPILASRLKQYHDVFDHYDRACQKIGQICLDHRPHLKTLGSPRITLSEVEPERVARKEAAAQRDLEAQRKLATRRELAIRR